MSMREVPFSCDNAIALADVTDGAHVIFGKNSDRPARESQPLVFNPGAKTDTNATLELAYCEIPEASETYTTVGTAPYWCWGYELGVNEHDVVAGNEAVFTAPLRSAVEASEEGDGPDRGLLGMEFVRLGLERGTTAGEVVDVIAELLEEYGQFGSAIAGEDDVDGSYDNSYLIADPESAWILETAGRSWAAKQIDAGTTSISNELTIRNHWDRGSDGLRERAVEEGLWDSERSPFDFAEAYTDHETPLQVSRLRYRRSQRLLTQFSRSGDFDHSDMQRILRDHYEETFLEGPKFNPALPDFLTICMHSSPAEFTWGNTVSSAIFELPVEDGGFTTMWWTPGPPCIGAYVPVYVLSGGVPDIVSSGGAFGRSVRPPESVPEDEPSPDSYWWRFKELLDVTKGDERGSAFDQNSTIVRSRFDQLETEFRVKSQAREEKARELIRAGDRDAAADLLSTFTSECVDSVLDTVDSLIETLQDR